MRMGIRRALPVVVVLLAAAAAAHADEYTVVEFEGGYLDPGAVQTSVTISTGQDDRTVEVQLPFEFPYFGRLQSAVSVCSNGWMAFGTSTTTLSDNPSLPSAAAPNGVVAPLWDDLTTGTGTVQTFTLGAAPDRVFVVEWLGIDTFSGTSQNDLSFQAQLHESTGEIVLAYAADGTWDGLSFTAGIEDPTGTVAFGGPNTDNDNAGQPLVDQRFSPRISVVAGQLLRDRPVADASGLGNSEELGLPVVGAEVRLIREDTGETVAVARTDDGGGFDLIGRGVDDPVTLSIDLLTRGTAANVVAPGDVTYVHRFTTGVAADPATAIGIVTLDTAVDGLNPSFRRALNIHQACQRGLAVADDGAAFAATSIAPQSTAEVFTPLTISWFSGAVFPNGTSYVPASIGTAARGTVSDALANPDPYDDDVILRLYAEHVLATISAHPGALPTPRGFAVTTTSEAAFADGFAHWFAASVQGRATLVDTSSATAATVVDLETPPAGARGPSFPAAVAGSLWDLVDAADEIEDEVAGSNGLAPSSSADVLATIDRRLDALAEGATGFTVRSFFDVWRIDGDVVERVRTARVFIHHGTLADDANEPNDRADEATLSGGIGTALRGLSLAPFNDDTFDVVLPGPAPVALTISLSQSTETDLDLELFDPLGASIAFASTVGGSDRSSLTIAAAAPLAAGTYTVRVGWRAGDTASYGVSFFRPLLVTRGTLPDWTAGVPFKEDLSAAGGVAPFQFAVQQAVPGLIVAENGTRLTGTPATAGDYDIDVTVTDTATPAGTAAVTIPFHVNAPLTVPATLGIAANAPFDVALGTGGTASTWTPVLQPPGAALLAGGDTLRLSGPATPPAAFDVRGTGVDAVGASLDPPATLVVLTERADRLRGAAVPGGTHFGYYVDALGGSVLDFKLVFKGLGDTPSAVAFLDATGVEIAAATPLLRTFGRKVTLKGVVAPTTGRYHLILIRDNFVGTVNLRRSVEPPRRLKGQAPVFEGADPVEVTFEALAGARLEVRLDRAPAPANLRPTVVEIEAPDGSLLSLPTERRSRGGRRAELRIALPQDGTYILRTTGREGSTGPLLYRLRLRTPRGVALDLDD